METVELTNMCLIEDPKNQSVLVIDRKSKDWQGVAFPGGHIEKGESIVDSVIREVEEETGLKIQKLSICGVKNWYEKEKNKRYIVFLFKTSSFQGELIDDCDEGDVFWIPKDEVYKLNLADGFDKMLEIFFDDIYNEHFIKLNKKINVWEDILK